MQENSHLNRGASCKTAEFSQECEAKENNCPTSLLDGVPQVKESLLGRKLGRGKFKLLVALHRIPSFVRGSRGEGKASSSGSRCVRAGWAE